VLSRDPLATAKAPQTTPWVPAADTPRAIEDNGMVGANAFDEPTPTSVQVTHHLQGAPTAAMRFYAATAIRSGWHVSTPTCHAYGDAFTASKQFPGWVATAVVGTARFKGAPALTVSIDTDYHGRPGTPKTLPHNAPSLTLDDLAATCIGDSP
jgi:hypothetical protein